mgnify:CR=1 FL=1
MKPEPRSSGHLADAERYQRQITDGAYERDPPFRDAGSSDGDFLCSPALGALEALAEELRRRADESPREILVPVQLLPSIEVVIELLVKVFTSKPDFLARLLDEEIRLGW